MSVPVSLPRAFALAIGSIERTLWHWKQDAPWLHAAAMASRLLRTSPALWRVYQAGIAAGYPSEYQKPRPIRTARDRHWQRIEQAARQRVAASATPLTLRAAVLAVMQTPQGRRWYRAYARTPARRHPPLATRRRKEATR